MRNQVNNASPSSATLLEQLLNLLRQGGVRSLAQVAAELDTSPALVESMLEDLARRGYLRPVEASCAPACAGCAQSCHGAVTGAGRAWRHDGQPK